MSEPYIGEIRLVAFTFAPSGWALCNGQLLAISQNEALFQLIGTTYGGDAVESFALPNLQGRVPIHQGQGPGLSPRVIGEAAGSTSASITVASLPVHEHSLVASSGAPSTGAPSGGFLATATDALYGSTGGAADFGPLAATGSVDVLSHENQQPYLVMNYVISLFGVFPSQN